jgi:hypothetical protein
LDVSSPPHGTARRSGKENSISLESYLSVVHGCALRVGYKAEAMTCALRCTCGDGDRYRADLQETARKRVHRVVDFGKLVDDSVPLNVDGINVAAEISQSPVGAQAIRDGKGIINRADVFRLEPSLTTLQIDFAAE